MDASTVSKKNTSIFKYLLALWFCYVSSGNNFSARGAINNNEYCSITNKHTMCSPEVRVILYCIRILHYLCNIYISLVCIFLYLHTFMCFYVQGYGPQCGSPSGLGRGISQNDIKEILHVHNKWRAKIANGFVTRGRPGPQPPAANMEKMVIYTIT